GQLPAGSSSAGLPLVKSSGLSPRCGRSRFTAAEIPDETGQWFGTGVQSPEDNRHKRTRDRDRWSRAIPTGRVQIMSTAVHAPAEAAATELHSGLDQDLRELAGHKRAWAQTPVTDRIRLLEKVKSATYEVAETWAELGAERKGIAGTPLAGEEWTSGPWAMLAALDNYCFTLANIEGNRQIAKLKKRVSRSGQTKVRVFPHSVFDRLLLSGVYADVWMEPGVTPANLSEHTAGAYREPAATRKGKLSLVLGAGNISS